MRGGEWICSAPRQRERVRELDTRPTAMLAAKEAVPEAGQTAKKDLCGLEAEKPSS